MEKQKHGLSCWQQLQELVRAQQLVLGSVQEC
jgi:hypothetical protein